MKYLVCLFLLLLSANPSFADKETKEPTFIDPNDVGGTYIDPYDVGNFTDPNDQDGDYIDPYDLPSVIEEEPKKDINTFEVLRDDLMAGAKIYRHDANIAFKNWKKINFEDPKPEIDWSQVRIEIGAGYVGAFGGSIAGVFSGFLLGSLVEGVGACNRCWVSYAVNMSTIGATLGGSAGVYMFGNNRTQQGSAITTYMGTLLPLMVGAIAYNESRQLNKNGFYLLTMPLMATLGYNLSRHYRKKGEEPLFDNFLEADEMWVSKDRENLLALNARWTF